MKSIATAAIDGATSSIIREDSSHASKFDVIPKAPPKKWTTTCLQNPVSLLSFLPATSWVRTGRRRRRRRRRRGCRRQRAKSAASRGSTRGSTWPSPPPSGSAGTRSTTRSCGGGRENKIITEAHKRGCETIVSVRCFQCHGVDMILDVLKVSC